MTGLIILAAGASVRLGKPKQTLVFKGKSLIQHAIESGIQAHCKPIVVVTGAYASQVVPETQRYAVHVVYNAAWEEGMASGIRCGVGALMKEAPQATGVILMVCDQPFADAILLMQLIQKKQETGKPVIASIYNHTLGVPALFSLHLFPDLLALQGQEGARKLLITHAHSVATVAFPLGGIDIDTLSDYEQLTGMDSGII